MTRRERLPVCVAESSAEFEIVGGCISRREGTRAARHSFEDPGDAGAEEHRLGPVPAEIFNVGMIGDSPDCIEGRADHDRTWVSDKLDAFRGAIQKSVRLGSLIGESARN